MWQLCPTCTMLSNLVPSPIDVTPSAARSTHEFAPISTKSAISTRPTCENLSTAAFSTTRPNPSARLRLPPHPHEGRRLPPAPLRKLVPPFVFHHVADPVRPDHASRVQHAPPTDIHVVVYRHVGMQHA